MKYHRIYRDWRTMEWVVEDYVRRVEIKRFVRVKEMRKWLDKKAAA